MKNEPNRIDEPKRHHAFDGIEEYDNKLPNWWLATFYSTIIFAIAYWSYYYQHYKGPSPEQQVEATIGSIRSAKAVASQGVDDATLWAMSQNAATVAAGAKTFATLCASCHAENMMGRIGPNLTDRVWLHGGRPTNIRHTITEGESSKGMPTWGPILGPTKINELVALILSKHDRAEPEMQPGFHPQTASAHP
jgi:cytochrome c oxidase cbb3-type subunit III